MIMKFQATYTDLFCGEFNYSRCKRVDFELPDNATDIQIVRKAKYLLGISGLKANSQGYSTGESIVRFFGGTGMIIEWGE